MQATCMTNKSIKFHATHISIVLTRKDETTYMFQDVYKSNTTDRPLHERYILRINKFRHLQVYLSANGYQVMVYGLIAQTLVGKYYCTLVCGLLFFSSFCSWIPLQTFMEYTTGHLSFYK